MPFKIVLFCIIAFCLVIGSTITYSVVSTSVKKSKIEFIDSWTVIDSSGKSFSTDRTFTDNRAYTEDFTIVSHLPPKINIESLLCFKNRSNVTVFIGGEKRFEFDRIKDTGIPGGSLEEFYVTVPLSPTDGSAEVRMVRSSTDWNPVIVPETFVASIDGLYNYLFSKYGPTFILTLILFVGSLIVTLIGIVLRIWKRQTIDMLYGALGILNVACWLISVSHITPMFTRILYVDGIWGYLFCMMMPFALLIYINSIQKGRYKLGHDILFILSLLSLILWSALHFSGVQSFQKSLLYIDLTLGVVILFEIVTLMIDAVKGHAKEYPFTAIGFLIFLIMSGVEIVLILFFESISNELPMLIGLMCLLVLMVIQQVDDIKKVRDALENEVKRKTLEKEQMLIHIVQTLAGTIDAKDKYTNGHSSRVADYSKEIARRAGYSEAELTDIYMMGLLHDIGKIGVPDSVINKPDKLTEYEYGLMKKHPIMGANILSKIEEKKELAIGARWHHERYDGKGYPEGLKGEEIPEQVRIITVADAYDTMTSYRSYRDPLPQASVIEEFEKNSGTQFDPRFTKIMIDMIREDKNYDLRD